MCSYGLLKELKGHLSICIVLIYEVFFVCSFVMIINIGKCNVYKFVFVFE